MFSFDISDGLKVVLAKLSKKAPVRAAIIYKKIEHIISSDEKTIDNFKNLRHGLSEYKRAHIDKSFVLLFKVTKSKEHILFDRIGHHDDIYK
ncbi:MAG: addiction module toxin RelE [Nanoarchaeota archaeon]|nr:addiction module toxin RelE [Nanoarchaeota archaeon]